MHEKYVSRHELYLSLMALPAAILVFCVVAAARDRDDMLVAAVRAAVAVARVAPDEIMGFIAIIRDTLEFGLDNAATGRAAVRAFVRVGWTTLFCTDAWRDTTCCREDVSLAVCVGAKAAFRAEVVLFAGVAVVFCDCFSAGRPRAGAADCLAMGAFLAAARAESTASSARAKPIRIAQTVKNENTFLIYDEMLVKIRRFPQAKCYISSSLAPFLFSHFRADSHSPPQCERTRPQKRTPWFISVK